MIADASCQLCGASNESILHMLRECPQALQVWNLICFDTSPPFFQDDGLSWIKHYASGLLSHVGLFGVLETKKSSMILGESTGLSGTLFTLSRISSALLLGRRTSRVKAEKCDGSPRIALWSKSMWTGARSATQVVPASEAS